MATPSSQRLQLARRARQARAGRGSGNSDRRCTFGLLSAATFLALGLLFPQPTDAATSSAADSTTPSAANSAPPTGPASAEPCPVPGHALVPLYPRLRPAVTRHDWSQVAALLQGKAPCELGHVGRLLAVRAALESDASSNAAYALQQLADLVQTLPELRYAIEKLERRARDAAQSDPLKLMNASRVLDAAALALEEERPNDAAALLERAARLGVAPAQQPRLHVLRARHAIGHGDRYRAYITWRWLLLNDPGGPYEREATRELTTHYPDHPLSRDDRLIRFEAFKRNGQVESLEAELRLLEPLKPRLSEFTQAHALGTAAYKARHFERAASEFLRAATASGGGPDSTLARYQAARALVRLGRLEQATLEFERVAAQPPKSSLTGDALFALAQARSFQGEWGAAARTYGQQLTSYPGSSLHISAQREGALALFAAGALEDAAAGWFRMRQQYGTQGEGTLHMLLEALSLDWMGNATRATALLGDVIAQAPLGFAGFGARDALKRVHPLPERDEEESTSHALSSLVLELEAVGLLDEAEYVAARETARWRSADPDGGMAASCRELARLTHGRERYLVGIEAAARNRFFERPETAPRWLWECVYPAPYSEWTRAAAAEFDVPISLLYAIMRQESGFRPGVRSPANALGLMQFIEPTAKAVAASLQLEFDSELLRRPETSVRFGSFYLRQLLNQFGEHPGLAAAAYNAGPEITTVWLSAGWRLPLSFFVARIPFRETRIYVQRVLANMMVYHSLYESGPPPAMTSLPEPAAMATLPL